MFTDNEKTTILFYLGWPGKTLKEGSQLFNRVVNDRLENIPDPVLKRTRTILKGLEAMDERLNCGADRLSASKIDDITMNEDEMDQLRKERFLRIREMSDLLNINIVRTSPMINVGIVV